MNKDELGKIIYEVSNIKGKFLLRSGQTATKYFDKYLFESQPEILIEIARKISEILPTDDNMLAGLEMGGIPIATAISLHTGRKVLFVRKAAKKYGTCKLAEGGEIKGMTLIIIEDVVTSGGAVIDATKALRSSGAVVQKVYCVIDREGTGRENLEKMGLEFFPLFTKSELENYL